MVCQTNSVLTPRRIEEKKHLRSELNFMNMFMRNNNYKYRQVLVFKTEKIYFKTKGIQSSKAK